MPLYFKFSAGSLWALLIVSLAMQNACSQSAELNRINGVVTYEAREAAPFVRVLLLPDSAGAITDQNGAFQFKKLKPGRYVLLVTAAGYLPSRTEAEVRQGEITYVQVSLQEAFADLAEVLIVDEHAKQEHLLHTDHLSWKELLQDARGTFVQSLARLPGMDAINTGVGIAKPVIRGLSFNRVIVNDQGIKQEGQQWGADHGLEIDAFSVSRVEVLRGPASLQYGSDGLGGVINIFPDPIPDQQSVSGSLTTLAKSNNGHLGASARVAVNRQDVWFSARYSHQAFGDYQVPADQFVFQGFVLPVFDQRLKNTAGSERALRLETGLRRNASISRITFSQYELESGLFAGAIGRPRAYALQPDGNRRNVDFPAQRVAHAKLFFNQTFFLGAHHLVMDAGFQRNVRREFGFPEFHNQPEIDPSNTLALQLDLDTWALNAHFEQEGARGFTHVYGISSQRQQNRRAGWEFLLPDFRLWRAGAFWIGNYQPANLKWRLSGGLRLDAGRNQSDFFQRYVWNSNGVVTDSLSVPLIDRMFYNWSGSFGFVNEFRPESGWFRAHFGKTFRIPYPSETSSNGVHHGTFRHEQGTPDLVSEQGYQLDLGLDLTHRRFALDLSAYANYFNNFIYLAPSGRLSRLPEAGQIFRYLQHDAVYAGFEATVKTDLKFGFVWEISGDYVWNYNLVTGLSLPFTPHPTFRNDLKWEKSTRFSWAAKLQAGLSHQYRFANGPLRVDRNEAPTPAFQVWDASLGGECKYRKGVIIWSFQAQNLLNTAYLQHLSRYRLINLPEQGRNLVFALHFPIE